MKLVNSRRANSIAFQTAALQSAITAAAANNKLLFLDYGLYRVTSTLNIPPNSRIVGESYSIILSSGGFFSDMNNPQPVLKVGAWSGQPGRVELADFVVSTQNAQPGAILIEYNLATPTDQEPAGIWDVSVRVGGFTGSQLQYDQCMKTPGSTEVRAWCIGGFMSMHVTSGASRLYMENVWLW